jgi:hypothetical protein
MKIKKCKCQPSFATKTTPKNYSAVEESVTLILHNLSTHYRIIIKSTVIKFSE